MMQPFLLRFRKPCQSPSRGLADAFYYYDNEADVVVDGATNPATPAIDSDRRPGPRTKKEDIETGEDRKDRRMWS